MKNNAITRAVHRMFRSNETALHDLNYIFWECTWRCNLCCRHCGSDCTTDGRVKDMPFEDFLNAILPIREKVKGDILIAITGGEPLLRKDLPDCGRALRQHGFKWGIVSNGYAYDAAMHAKLMAAGMSSITISLDGLEETHNRFRGNPHSFERAIRALKLIVSAGDQLNYDVVTCVHKDNLDELPAMRDMLISLGVKAWRFFMIAPIGRAANDKDLQLNKGETIRLMEFIAQTRKEGKIDAKFSCEAYVGKYEGDVRDSFFFCRAGVNIASVLIDGSISACPNINRSFVQGNIYRERFIDVWENRFQVMRDRSWCKERGLCADCKAFKDCRGGAMHLWNEKQDSIAYCVYKRLNS